MTQNALTGAERKAVLWSLISSKVSDGILTESDVDRVLAEGVAERLLGDAPPPRDDRVDPDFTPVAIWAATAKQSDPASLAAVVARKALIRVKNGQVELSKPTKQERAMCEIEWWLARRMGTSVAYIKQQYRTVIAAVKESDAATS